jgi:proton-coupled amino acid transporter
MVMIGVMLGYAIQFFVAVQIMFPKIQDTWKIAERHPVTAECIFRSVMVLVTFTIAQLVPNLSLLLSLIGSLCCSVLVFIFPSIIDLIVTKERDGNIGIGCWIKNITILVIAIAGFLTGGALSIKNIVDEIMSKFN